MEDRILIQEMPNFAKKENRDGISVYNNNHIVYDPGKIQPVYEDQRQNIIIFLNKLPIKLFSEMGDPVLFKNGYIILPGSKILLNVEFRIKYDNRCSFESVCSRLKKNYPESSQQEILDMAMETCRQNSGICVTCDAYEARYYESMKKIPGIFFGGESRTGYFFGDGYVNQAIGDISFYLFAKRFFSITPYLIRDRFAEGSDNIPGFRDFNSTGFTFCK